MYTIYYEEYLKYWSLIRILLIVKNLERNNRLFNYKRKKVCM
jgi:hypothetical protein